MDANLHMFGICMLLLALITNMGNISATNLDNICLVLGVIEDAELISDIFKIGNGSFKPKEAIFQLPVGRFL